MFGFEKFALPYMQFRKKQKQKHYFEGTGLKGEGCWVGGEACWPQE